MKRSIKNQSSFVLSAFVRQLRYFLHQFIEQSRIQIYKHWVKVVKKRCKLYIAGENWYPINLMWFGDKLKAETCPFTDAQRWKASRTELSTYTNLLVCTRLYVEHNSTQAADYLCEKHLRCEVYTNSRERAKRKSGECLERAISIYFMPV